MSIIPGPATNPSIRTERRFLDAETMVVEVERAASPGAEPWVTRQVYVKVK